MEYAVDNQISQCNLCSNINSILLSKPKIFKGSDNLKVMIIGHSPTVRVSEKASVVLKMDKPNGGLYKYITNEIISPLGIQLEELYCTNLIKCNTKMLPEDLNKKNKKYIDNVFNNCSRLLEREVEEINPELIISLSGRVFEILSEKYIGKKMKIKDNFGKPFTLKIGNKEVKYIPVIHIPKYKKIRDYYFPEQTSRLISLKNTLILL
jgi:Uracil-DNA glycosylase